MTDLIEKYSLFSEIVNSYRDLAEPFASDLLDKNGLKDSAEELAKTIDHLKSQARALNIGVIGKVKAGKSSLLNALFFGGQDILPKAATPMTAALTVIAYAEKPQAEITYYSAKDICNLKSCFDQYERTLNEICQSFMEKPEYDGNEKKVRGKAQNELKKNERLAAAHDQYSKMIDSGLLPEFQSDRDPEIIEECDSKTLIKVLHERVGSSGRYMPFTKSVKLMLDLDELKDLEIVDTPGLDDPIISRSERTEKYLSQAEVVFIVSPSAAFLSQEDFNLMDRLSGKRGEGIRELFLVSSQVDTQLYGPEVREKSNHILKSAVEYVNSQNSEHAVSKLAQISEAERSQYGQLADNTRERLFPTSAMAEKMLANYSDMENWDDEMKLHHRHLLEYYGDSFGDEASDKASLKILSGIDTIRTRIFDIKKKKEEIQERKCSDLIAGKVQAFAATLRELRNAITAEKHKLENITIKDAKKQREELQRVRTVASCLIEDLFQDSIRSLMSDMRNVLNKGKRDLMSKVRSDAENERTTESRIESYTTGFWFWKKKHYHTYEVNVVRPGAVKSILDNLIGDLNSEMTTAISESHENWRKQLQKRIVEAVQESLPKESNTAVITAEDIKIAISKQIRSFILDIPDLCELSYRKLTPGIGNYSSKLEGSMADRFEDEVLEYLNSVGNGYSEYLSKYLNELEHSLLDDEPISVKIFRNLDRTIKDIEEKLESKEAVLKRFAYLENELEKL